MVFFPSFFHSSSPRQNAADAIDIYITADCESTQDFIDVSEDEANIDKNVTPGSTLILVMMTSTLVCPMVDRLKPLYVYTSDVYAITTTAMYKYAYCCDAWHDACLATAALGSDNSTLGLLQLVVNPANISQQNKTAYYREYTEEGKDEQKEKEKKTALPSLPRVRRQLNSSPN